MGNTLSQYRAAIGLWNRPSAQKNKPYDRDTAKSLHSGNINNVVGFVYIMCLVSIVLLNSVSLDLDLNATLMSRQCLQALLVISGVEQNPGPVSQQEVIEELCNKSANEVINKILRAYPLGQTFAQQRTAMNKFKKEELVLTLEFLKLTNQDKKNKPQIVHNLIVRIQNLLPDTCGLCKQEYYTSLEDIPLLTCEVCGQGSHNSCLISILGVEEAEKNSLDPIKARKIIIPLDLPGVHYLCMTCSSENIPDDNDGILKKKVHDSTEVEVKIPEGVQPPETIEVEAIPSNPVLSEDAHSQPDPGNNGSQLQPQPQVPNQGNNEKIICPFFRKGQCKHGISGRGCKNDHPQTCKKLMRHGAKAPHGCTLGRSRCDKFHPNMCPDSMTKGECTNPSCKLWHVSGTRKSFKNKTMTPSNQMGAKREKDNQTSSTEIPNDFLGLLQRWKMEMMEAMDTKLAMALKQSAASSPRHPSLETLPVLAHNQVLPQNYYNLPMGGQRSVMATGQPILVQMAPNVMYH